MKSSAQGHNTNEDKNRIQDRSLPVQRLEIQNSNQFKRQKPRLGIRTLVVTGEYVDGFWLCRILFSSMLNQGR